MAFHIDHEIFLSPSASEEKNKGAENQERCASWCETGYMISR